MVQKEDEPFGLVYDFGRMNEHRMRLDFMVLHEIHDHCPVGAPSLSGGTKTPEQLAALRRTGCNMGRGF